MKKLFLALFLFAQFTLLTGCSSDFLGDLAGDNEKKNRPMFTIETNSGEIDFNVEIADTYEERKQGLMFREELKDGSGMIFVFDDLEERSFWMKNTLIPLDIIFLDDKYEVVHISKDARPCKTDPCANFNSNKPAKYVLEIGSGQSDVKGISVGDTGKLIIR